MADAATLSAGITQAIAWCLVHDDILTGAAHCWAHRKLGEMLDISQSCSLDPPMAPGIQLYCLLLWHLFPAHKKVAVCILLTETALHACNLVLPPDCMQIFALTQP